jgi:iron complex transport system substrate-binding protein
MNCKHTYSRRGARRGAVAAWAVIAAVAAGGPAFAAGPQRVVSINLCTDQLVLALADRGQIAGLSRFSQHGEMSLLARQAKGLPSLRGSAEEVLRLKPDLVLGGAFSGRATRKVVAGRGIRLETFAPPQSIPEAKAEIERAARLLGHPDRGARLVAQIDAAVAAGRDSGGGGAPRVLLVQRRGFVSGRETLLSSAIEAIGLVNAAGALGVSSIARAPLETIVKLRPDVLVLEALGVARDQSSALLLHPALASLRDPARVWRLPVAEVTCGGPALPALLRRLVALRGGIE